MQNTTLYLIRHSIKYDIKDIVEDLGFKLIDVR